MPTAVVAIGGNSLVADPKHQTVPDQFAATRETAADTREWEREIDARVYQLYGLTAEEVAVVEGTISGLG